MRPFQTQSALQADESNIFDNFKLIFTYCLVICEKSKQEECLHVLCETTNNNLMSGF